MTAGIGGVGQSAKLWVLTDLDRGEDVVGQFAPQGLAKTVAAQLASASSAGQQYPILQWVCGELETISFNAKLWTADSMDLSLEDRLDRLEGMVKAAKDLRRPPVCAFSWGYVAHLTIDCLVRSLGTVTYDEVRSDGTPRGVALQLTLDRYEPPELRVTDPTVPEKFTRVRRARRGDTYESLALEEYGDPLLGVLLRQLNPRVPGMARADLRPTDPVHVFPEEYLLTLPVEPQFHTLRRGPGNEAAAAARRRYFDARAGDGFALAFPAAGDEENDE